MAVLSDLLLADKICTNKQIEEALRNQVIMGGTLGTNLIDLGYLDEEKLALYLSLHYQVPSLSGNQIQVASDAFVSMTADMVQRFGVIPYQMQAKKLLVLCLDPSNLVLLDEVAFATGMQVRPIVVPEVRYWLLLQGYYGISPPVRYLTLNEDHLAAVATQISKQPVEALSVEDGTTADLISEEDFERFYHRCDGFLILPHRSPQQTDAQAAEAVVLGRLIDDDETPEGALPEQHASDMPLLAQDDLEIIEELPQQIPGEQPIWTQPSWTQHVDSSGSTQPALAGSGSELVENASQFQQQAPHAQQDEIIYDGLEIVEPLENEWDQALSFAQAGEMLQTVNDRDRVANIVLRAAHSGFDRCLLLVVNRGYALGWDGLGFSIQREKLRQMVIPLDQESAFQTVYQTNSFYLGPFRKQRINVLYLRSVGGQIPRSAFILPVLARGRLVNMLYGDNGHHKHCRTDVGELLVLAQRISHAYELIYQNRIKAFEANR